MLLSRSGVVVNSAHGAVFERDWLTAGDGLLTYDSIHRREWLDLSVSRLDQFPEPRLANAIAELEPGRIFEGFTWPKRQSVQELAVSAGIDLSSSNLNANQDSVNALIDLLGPTREVGSPPRYRDSAGFINEQVDFNSAQFGVSFIVNVTLSTGSGYACACFGTADGLLNERSTGLMLYRTVPEPSSIACALTYAYIIISNLCRVAVPGREKTKRQCELTIAAVS
jgi:hypothetical protein